MLNRNQNKKTVFFWSVNYGSAHKWGISSSSSVVVRTLSLQMASIWMGTECLRLLNHGFSTLYAFSFLGFWVRQRQEQWKTPHQCYTCQPRNQEDISQSQNGWEIHVLFPKIGFKTKSQLNTYWKPHWHSEVFESFEGKCEVWRKQFPCFHSLGCE